MMNSDIENLRLPSGVADIEEPAGFESTKRQMSRARFKRREQQAYISSPKKPGLLRIQRPICEDDSSEVTSVVAGAIRETGFGANNLRAAKNHNVELVSRPLMKKLFNNYFHENKSSLHVEASRFNLEVKSMNEELRQTSDSTFVRLGGVAAKAVPTKESSTRHMVVSEIDDNLGTIDEERNRILSRLIGRTITQQHEVKSTIIIATTADREQAECLADQLQEPIGGRYVSLDLPVTAPFSPK